MKKVIVLGGAGFIGSNICEYLMKCGYDVISITHQASNNNRGYVHKEIVFDLIEEGNISFLLQQIDECDVCIILSWVGTKERDRLDINLESANKLLTVFKAFTEKFPASMYIQVGSAAEYGHHDYETVTEDSLCEPFSPYGKGKLLFYKQASEYSRENNINFIELRFHSVFGMENDERQMIIRVIFSLLRCEHISMRSDCNQLWNFISVNNACQIIHRVIEKGGLLEDVYNVGCNEVKSLRQYLMQLTELCGVEQKMISFGNQPDTESYNFIFDSSRIQKEMTWEPTDDFEDVIASIKERFKSGYQNDSKNEECFEVCVK